MGTSRQSSRSSRPGQLGSRQAANAAGLDDWEVDLADLEQAAIGSANFKVGSADSELAGSPPLLLVGARSSSMIR